MNYVAPGYHKDAFNCPHCRAYAHQQWFSLMVGGTGERQTFVDTTFPVSLASAAKKEFEASRCQLCKESAIWVNKGMIYPHATVAPLPEPNMPDEIKQDFEEARQVFSLSPRSSAALLRLAIQKLCKHLGYSGKNLNEDVGKMVARGLDTEIQQAFDAVRVIGNESVHPGQIDLRDDPETALQLFRLVNFIVEEMITRKRRVQEIYSKLPQGALQQIDWRDNGNRAKPATHS